MPLGSLPNLVGWQCASDPIEPVAAGPRSDLAEMHQRPTFAVPARPWSAVGALRVVSVVKERPSASVVAPARGGRTGTARERLGIKSPILRWAVLPDRAAYLSTCRSAPAADNSWRMTRPDRRRSGRARLLWATGARTATTGAQESRPKTASAWTPSDTPVTAGPATRHAAPSAGYGRDAHGDPLDGRRSSAPARASCAQADP